MITVITAARSLSEMTVVGPREPRPPRPDLGSWLESNLGLITSCEEAQGGSGTLDTVEVVYEGLGKSRPPDLPDHILGIDPEVLGFWEAREPGKLL